MKLLQHLKNAQGYTVRIWLDESDPTSVREYTWAPYKSDDSEWNFTEAEYQDQQIDQAMKLAQQELDSTQVTVLTQDKTALKALDEATEESDGR